MPTFRRRTARRPRRAPVRKYRARTGRSRFTRKRFGRNSVNQLTMRAPLASRLLRVKLPWVKTFEASIASASSQSYAFQGNGIVPYTVAGQTLPNTPAAGDSLPAGEIEYSQLYDKYFINGSSINVEIVNNHSTTATIVLRAVLLAIPFGTSAGANDTWAANKAQLDAYTYEQLLAWPYAKWRMIGTNTGGYSALKFKMFRKTKHMCGLKDLRDNQDFGSQLTDGSTSVGSGTGTNPQNGFMYYLRLFNVGSATTATAIMTVRMSLYITMTNREFNPVQTITI